MKYKISFSKESLKEKWHYFALIAIFIIAFYIRNLPKTAINSSCLPGMVCMQALDPYWFYRMGEYIINNNFHLMNLDILRQFPTGFDPHVFPPVSMYAPAVLYGIFKIIGLGGSWADFAQSYAPLMGALTVIPVFFLGKEMFNKLAGTFAAFFYATSSSVLYRTSAGFIEKEPTAGFFMICTIYFWVRALRTNSLLSGVVSSLFASAAIMTWGGSTYLYYLIPGITFFMLLVNIQPKSILKAFTPLYVIPILLQIAGIPSHVNLMPHAFLGMVMIGIIIFSIARLLVEKKNWVEKENLKYFIPALTVAAGFLLVFASFFSPAASNLTSGIINVFSVGKGTLGTTVAESNPGNWDVVKNNLGAAYSINAAPYLKQFVPLANLWIWMLLGVAIMAYNFYKTKGREWQSFLVIVWVFVTILGVYNQIRLTFMLGFPAAIAGGYALSRIINYLRNLDIVKKSAKADGPNVYATALVIFVALIFFINFSAGQAFGKGVGSSPGGYWLQAMDFLKSNTTEDSVVLSWWDYGYWFQSLGERASIVDGGNVNHTINVQNARVFTSTNISAVTPFYEYYRPDYLVVDYTLIGKYSAMSRIANNGAKTDGFVELKLQQKVPKNNRTLMIYSLGPNSFWIPVNNQGGLAGNIIFSSQGGEVYIKYLCTANGLVDLNPPEDKPTWDVGCLIFSNYGVFLPYNFAPEGRPITESGLSNIAKMYIFSGQGIDFLEKVFDNNYIKIYKINRSLLQEADKEMYDYVLTSRED